MLKKWALAQVDAGSDMDKNMDTVLNFIQEAAEDKCELIAFPEYFLLRDSHERMFQAPLSVDSTPIKTLCAAAEKFGINLLAGTVALAAGPDKAVYNTALVINELGEIDASYSKIHLFDIDLKNEFKTRESDYISRGDEVVTADIAGLNCGLAICYDLRFPELFRNLVGCGAEVIVIPANFTRETGRAHWETLLRARAIENQCYVVAPNQIGTNRGTGIASFGNSLVVDPWGQVIARASDTTGWIPFHLDMQYLQEVRRQLPVLEHIELL